MSADNRSPITDALATLGMIHTKPEHRDAIHLGVEPVEAGELLRVGADVCLIDGKAYELKPGHKAVGIVDPFLGKHNGVLKGQRFWLIVYPRQITSLRHVWEHPDFPASGETAIQTAVPLTDAEYERAMELIDPAKQRAKAYLSELAESLDVTPDELLENATAHVKHDDYWSEGDKFEGHSIPDEFWKHYEVLTQTKVPDDKQYNFLSCSC